jgi:hypothetical protein
MIRTVTHKHLKRQIDILEKTEGIEDLLAELQFSTLLLPTNVENNTLSFPLVQIKEEIYAPVFTDIHEYNKINPQGDFTLIPNKFDFYLNLLDEKIDGIIIDVEGERFPITKEFQKVIERDNIFDYDPQVFTLKEIKQIKDSINNEKLEEFLKDESNWWDYEKLMELLLKSDLFKVVLSENDLSSKAKNGVISIHDMDMLPTALTAKATESYALIYTKEDEIIPKNSTMYPYLQLVNLPELINRVLLDDLDGIIINENSQNITIPREFLLNLLKDFKSPNIDKYDDYVFVLND